MEVKLEATLEAEAQVESRLGRMVGMSSAIVGDPNGPDMFFRPAGVRPLVINEEKFSVKKEG